MINLNYLPNPLCSREEKDIIASNFGALFDLTKYAKSVGDIRVTRGCVDVFGKYSRVVM